MHELVADLKQSLLAAHGLSVSHGGRRWKLDCSAEKDGRFRCDARNMTPQTPHEEKYCFTDLWLSESDDVVDLIYKFAEAGTKLTGGT